MRCDACGHDSPADAVYCEECGLALHTACPQCGQRQRAGTKFCRRCGHRLVIAPEGVLESPDPPPRSYTPRHLAERILTSRSALEGERKQVTVLFCDIVESSDLAERLGPETMHQLVDQALTLMAEAVHRYEGTVNQFLGDGLMALFGAPVAVEEHALRAVQAALAIRETISGFSEQLRREKGLEIRLRMGLNTGLVVVGRIGDDLRMDYTAIGDTTNLAARIQALAEPGTIIVTAPTHRLVEGYVRSEPLGLLQVKGRSEPVSAYRVIGRKRARTRMELAAERGLTQLVGRARELALLHDRLARAREGRGQVVAIVGEPGIGKSRTIYEFRRSLEGERVTWLEGHCLPYGQSTPYLAVLEILRANFHIEEGDNQLQISAKLREGIRQVDPGLEAIVPFLGDLFGLPVDTEALQRLDPKDRRQKTFEAIRALTFAAARRRLQVVVVEDLHWIDKTSEDYLAFAIESLAAVPILLITTHRPGHAVRWADKTFYTQIALDLLTEREAEAMVTAILGSRDAPLDFCRIVQEKAEGNPLFVEEITASLLERDVLVCEEGSMRWAGNVTVEVPASVQDIIRARIDRLDEPVKRIVQTAAVIGREFGFQLLARISEMAGEVQRYLDTLKHLELIHEKTFFPELEYIFKHALTQDVAYQTLLSHRRQELHGTVGRALEDLYAGRVEEQAGIIAYHHARSDKPAKGIAYALLAGDGAARLYANAEARTYYEQALELARKLPVSAESQRAQIDAILKLASVAFTREHFQQDLANLEHALALITALADQTRTSKVLYWIARTHYVRGQLGSAVEFSEKSLAMAESLRDESLIVWPSNLLGRICTVIGDYVKGSAMMQRCVGILERLGNRSELATASSILGVSLAAIGEFDQALKFSEQGLALARESQNLPAEAANLYYRAIVYEHKGEWDRVVESARAGLEIAERLGDRFRVYVLNAVLGYGLVRLGKAQTGIETIEKSIRLAEQLGTTYLVSWALCWLSEAYLSQGNVDQALTAASRARALLSPGSDAYGESRAARSYGDALFRKDPAQLAEAERHIESAIRLQLDKGMRPQAAISFVCHARLLRARGEGEGARTLLDRAATLFEEMGMPWHRRAVAEIQAAE
jgi:class 3 adenylate cyclase/tetratricopeptide (TPR) repeat protein/DNA polymerase III delta prime subunit